MRDRNGGGGVGRVSRQRTQPRRGLLIWLSGADVDSLAHTPREARKFVGLGGIVLTTAVLAAVSATFALTMGARVALYAAIPAGVLWGLAVMNLDRWLVTATQRRPKWHQNLLTALPRVLMALIVGAVISTPLVLWLFQREIDAELNVIHQRRLDQHQQKLLNDARFKAIPELQNRVATNQAIADGTQTSVDADPAVKELQIQYDNLDKRYQEAQNSATCEFDGTCGTKTRGGGEAYKQKQIVANDLRRQRDEVGVRLQQARAAAEARRQQTASAERASAAEQVKRDKAELDRLESLKKAEEDRFKVDTGNDRGLLARLEALSQLTGSNSTLKTAYTLLMLFITTIEVLPVAVKFLLNLAPPTTYDQILEKAEETDIIAADAEMERRQNMARFESQTRSAREEQLIRERVERMTAEGDDGRNGRTAPVGGVLREPATSRLMVWLRRRGGSTQPVSYAAWPDSEPTRKTGTTRTPQAPAEDSERMTERWTFDG